MKSLTTWRQGMEVISRFVSGHGFSRAAAGERMIRASAPDGWSTASAVHKNLRRNGAALAAEVTAGAKAPSEICPECTPEGVLHPVLPTAAAILLSVLFFTSFAAAQNITGTVTNGTTGKPSAGDEVTLLSLSQGMQEIGSTKSDAQGRFSFPAPTDKQAPHMVRATHQGVNYFPQGGPLMPGSTTAELTVYDSARAVDGLSQTVEVDRLQSDGKQLQGISLYAVTNKSEPPRTQANDKGTFEIVLPDGAVLESAQAKGPGGQPIATDTTPGGRKRTTTCLAIRSVPAKPNSRFPITCLMAARPASRPSRFKTCSISW